MTGVLPFLEAAALQEQGGAVVTGAISCTVWPAGGHRTGDGGRHFDHVGEAAFEHAAALQVPNRSLVLTDGRKFKIVEAIPQDSGIPHVALELLASAGGRA